MNSNLKLNIGCGAEKRTGWTGIDVDPSADIVHDLEDYPWPLVDSCASLIHATHVIEHINSANMGIIKWMNEVWRIAEPDANFLIITPRAGSDRFWHDPTHCSGFTEKSWFYFDPSYLEYGFYKPKPWKIETCGTNKPSSDVEVLLSKTA